MFPIEQKHIGKIEAVGTVQVLLEINEVFGVQGFLNIVESSLA